MQFDGDRGFEPDVGEDQALGNILEGKSDYYFAWEDDDWEQEIKMETSDSNATYYPQGELMWALENYNNLSWNIPSSKYRLAWHFDVLCLNPSFHKAYYVDALNGQVFRIEQLRCTNGPANILTQGTQTIDTRYYGGLTNKYILHTNDNGRDIHTKYYTGFPLDPWFLISNIKDKDDNWGNSEQLGTTAHWMLTQAWDFYVSAPYSRSGMDDNGDDIHVHADAAPVENAYYSNASGQDKMVFGYINNQYLAVIDVAGHEYTHGVDEHTADLTYESESGALDESFADIFGFMVERFSEPPGNLDWLIGEDAVSLRSMDNPGLFNQPDTYEGTNWFNVNGCNPSSNNDECGVHTNSGVQNFWFHFLAVGGNGTNDNGDAYNIAGIGIDDAARIAYWNHVHILQSGAQYADARAGAITSAGLMFGDCSNEQIQTTNAWAAVGVGDQSNCIGTGIVRVENEKPKLYPNPATNEIMVSFSSPSERMLQLYSIDGSLIRKLGTTKDQQYNISISSLAKGIYFLEVLEENRLYTIKFIKN